MRPGLCYLVLLSACDDPLYGSTCPNDLVEEPTHNLDIQPIWDGCCGASCHTGGATGGGLALDEGYGALVEVPSSVPGELLVAPEDLDGSYLWRKLEGTHSEVGGSGAAMPLSGTLGENARATIQAWIENGTPE